MSSIVRNERWRQAVLKEAQGELNRRKESEIVKLSRRLRVLPIFGFSGGAIDLTAAEYFLLDEAAKVKMTVDSGIELVPEEVRAGSELARLNHGVLSRAIMMRMQEEIVRVRELQMEVRGALKPMEVAVAEVADSFIQAVDFSLRSPGVGNPTIHSMNSYVVCLFPESGGVPEMGIFRPKSDAEGQKVGPVITEVKPTEVPKKRIVWGDESVNPSC